MFLIIDNFVPTEERTRLINMAHFDEDLDDWVIRKERKRPLPRERLVINNYRRPVTEYALDKDGIRYRVCFVFLFVNTTYLFFCCY